MTKQQLESIKNDAAMDFLSDFCLLMSLSDPVQMNGDRVRVDIKLDNFNDLATIRNNAYFEAANTFFNSTDEECEKVLSNYLTEQESKEFLIAAVEEFATKKSKDFFEFAKSFPELLNHLK